MAVSDSLIRQLHGFGGGLVGLVAGTTITPIVMGTYDLINGIPWQEIHRFGQGSPATTYIPMALGWATGYIIGLVKDVERMDREDKEWEESVRRKN